MKRSILVLTCLLLGMHSFAATFDLGVKASYNTSKLTTDLSTIKTDAKSGYNFGVFGRFGGSKIYLQPEFLYVVKSGEFTLNSVSDAVKSKYIQVPVLLGIKLIDLKVASVRAFTGPAVAFSTGYDSDKNFTYNFNNSAWNYQLGAGLDFLMLTFDVRYEWGVSKSFDTTNLSSNFSNKGNTFTVSIGYKFL
ncbi:MAG: PorT family protein [Marinilabiliales bacterium]|nr:PorT family protein [Marinilabiliales bacterium]